MNLRRLLRPRVQNFAVCFCAIFVGACTTPTASSTGAQTLHLPVQVYEYSFAAAPDLDSTMDRTQIDALFKRVNEVWQEADIQWDVQSVEHRRIDEKSFPADAAASTQEHANFKQRLQAIKPDEVKAGVWKVVIIREFPVKAGGIYIPTSKTVYFAERTRGGDTSPVILAHELGHSLALPHTSDTSDLMNPAAGARDRPEANATKLTASQVATVRAQALKGPCDQPTGQDNQMGRSGQSGGRRQGGGGGGRPSSDQQHQRIVERLKSFDSNDDGIVELKDVPSAGQPAFHRLDTNGDGKLDESELK